MAFVWCEPDRYVKLRGGLAMAASAEPVEDSRLVPCPKGPLLIASQLAGAEAGVRLSLVIPTLNEAKSLPALVQQLRECLEPVLGEAYELIVVDDDSPDRTWAVALELLASQPRLRVTRRRGERGLASAVVRGWQLARGSVLGVIDADLQHPPRTSLQLLAEIERGAELAVASRHVAGGGVSDWSLRRRALSRGAQLLGLLLLPGVLGRLSDPLSGYFMLRRCALSALGLDPLGYKILIEVLARGRFERIAEVGYTFRERFQLESKVTWRVYLQYVAHLLRLRSASLPFSQSLRCAEPISISSFSPKGGGLGAEKP
jgi:dolichol-phosphate mannosyltransferase